MQSDQSLCLSLDFSMTVKLQVLTEHHLEFLRLKEGYTISINHECESWIENSIPRITDWHDEACRVMTIGDPRDGL